MRFALHALIGAAALAALLTTARPLAAQELGWTAKSDASVSLFFGNTEQRVVTTHGSVGHADSTFELQTDLRFSYGEASADSGERIVSKRSWFASVSFNHQPFTRFSPFFAGSVESSLEKRIDLRYAVGAGANVNVVDEEGSQVDFSIAALGERTVASPAEGADTTAPVTSLLRGSARVRVEHALDPRVRVTSETTYQPALRAFDRFTVQSLTSLAYQMHRMLALTLSLRDSYDSEARLRGARENNEGEVVLGLQSKF